MDPRHHARVAALSVLTVLTVLMVLAGCSGDTGARTPPPGPEALRSVEVTSDEPTSIESGTYRIPSSAWSVADFTVTFPEGWTVQYGHVFSKNADEVDELALYSVVIDEIYTDACHGDGVTTQVGPGVDDLVAALRRQKGSVVSRPVSTTLAGLPATRVDLSVPRDLELAQCRLAEDGIEAIQVWYTAPADKYLVLWHDSPTSVYILEVEGRRQVFLTQHRSATSDEDRAELQSVLDSIRIGS